MFAPTKRCHFPIAILGRVLMKIDAKPQINFFFKSCYFVLQVISEKIKIWQQSRPITVFSSFVRLMIFLDYDRFYGFLLRRRCDLFRF